MPSLSRYSKPMLADEMLNMLTEVVIEKYADRHITGDDHIITRFIRDEIHHLLRCQIDVRGLADNCFARAMSEGFTYDLDLVRRTGRIIVPCGWTSKVDGKFRAGICNKCKRKVPIPWDHDQQECHDYIVSDVLDT